MTQRDRLVAALQEADGGLSERRCGLLADALIARGVRVVDAETLARALRRSYPVRKADHQSYLLTAAVVLGALDTADE